VEFNKVVFNGVEVDYCPQCLGLWFEEDELRQAKDEKDKNLVWLDFDLWQEREKFKLAPAPKLCPKCGVPMYETCYGDSGVAVDICILCRGVWLDRGEFKKIIDYLKKKGQDEVMHHYFKNLWKEAVEIFTGPENFKSELKDFLAIIKIMSHKFALQFPEISKMIAGLPK